MTVFLWGCPLLFWLFYTIQTILLFDLPPDLQKTLRLQQTHADSACDKPQHQRRQNNAQCHLALAAGLLLFAAGGCAAALLCTGVTAAGGSVFGAAGLLCTAGLAAGSSFPLLCVLWAALACFKRFALAAPVQVVFCLAVILRQLVLLKGGTGVALFQRLDGFVEQQRRLCAVRVRDQAAPNNPQENVR